MAFDGDRCAKICIVQVKDRQINAGLTRGIRRGLVLVRCRNVQLEDAAGGARAHQINTALVRFRDPTRDGKSQTRAAVAAAAGAGGIHAEESLENARLQIQRGFRRPYRSR